MREPDLFPLTPRCCLLSVFYLFLFLLLLLFFNCIVFVTFGVKFLIRIRLTSLFVFLTRWKNDFTSLGKQEACSFLFQSPIFFLIERDSLGCILPTSCGVEPTVLWLSSVVRWRESWEVLPFISNTNSCLEFSKVKQAEVCFHLEMKNKVRPPRVRIMGWILMGSCRVCARINKS